MQQSYEKAFLLSCLKKQCFAALSRYVCGRLIERQVIRHSQAAPRFECSIAFCPLRVLVKTNNLCKVRTLYFLFYSHSIQSFRKTIDVYWLVRFIFILCFKISKWFRVFMRRHFEFIEQWKHNLEPWCFKLLKYSFFISVQSCLRKFYINNESSLIMNFRYDRFVIT